MKTAYWRRAQSNRSYAKTKPVAPAPSHFGGSRFSEKRNHLPRNAPTQNSRVV